VTVIFDLEEWLRHQCNEYTFDARGVFQRSGLNASWPVHAADPDELERLLADRGHLLPLPQEPAALANILEVSIVNFLSDRLRDLDDAEVRRGTERGYPDLEISGAAFGGGFHAVDVKAARRAPTRGRPRTQSRITLYTGNTYFKWPDLHWPGTPRPFNDYASHLDLLLIYTLRPESTARVEDLEVIVQEPWRIASTRRSSTTREYIGAVDRLDDLRAGFGEFNTPQEFYSYWRKFPFRISAQVQNQLDRLVRQQADEIARLRRDQQAGA
jgi:hypothetical protein